MTPHAIVRTVATVALLSLPGTGSAAALLTQATPTTWTLIADGTSNTVMLSESSLLDVCVPQGAVPDGTSNTLLLSETSAIVWGPRAQTDGTSNTIQVGEDFCYRGIRHPTPIGQITDGTSNTIFLPENPIDVRDERFDVCFRGVTISTASDGTSNTIQVGEQPVCFQDVSVVPEPAMATVAAIALSAAVWRRRRREQ